MTSVEKGALPRTAKPTLWQPKPTNGEVISEPVYHLRVYVLKDGEGTGDCPNRRFVSLVSACLWLGEHCPNLIWMQSFKSLHHLTHATNRLEEAFGKSFEMNTCGLDKGDAMGGRLNDGRTENITIEYNSNVGANGGWKAFVDNLKKLEDEWDYEGIEMS